MRNKPLHNLDEIQRVFYNSNLDAVVLVSPRNLWGLTGAARAFARRPGYRRNSCAIAFRDTNPILISGRFQEEPSLIFSWIDDITTYSDYLESPLARAAEVLRQRGLASGRIGVEAWAHTTEFFDDLVQGLDNAEIVPCDDLLDEVWMVKQPEEIRVLEDNLHRMSAAIVAALEQSEAGEAEEAIHKRILAMMLRTGTASVWGTLVSGERLTSLSALPSQRKLMPGDMFRIDYGYVSRNYPVRICRMGVVGDATEEQQQAHKKFCEAFLSTFAKIGPNQTGQEIYEVIAEALARENLETNGASFGNAAGFGIEAERPRIQPFETMKTRPNVVLSVEPVTLSGYKTSAQIRITATGSHIVLPNSLPVMDQLLRLGR